jgi:acetyl-CoA carboxylase biotin carboxyl carrier protein
MTIEEIKELLDVFNASGVGELELQRGDDRIRIRKAGQPADYPAPAAPAPPPVQAVEAPGPAEIQAADDASQVLVKSPIVGTYYDAASPDSAPFVKVGDAVEPGQVLCIIESMKLMNEIEAEIGGVIVSKLVPNAQPVEYGEALFAIRPV